MAKNLITFQLATQYLSKMALRLEYLFTTITEACNSPHPIIHQYALRNLMEIIKLLDKPELKSRFLKELMTIAHNTDRAEIKITDPLYAALTAQIQFLSWSSGNFGQELTNDIFLQSIRFADNSNLDNDLQSPQLLLWLNSPVKSRQKNLQHWLQQLQSLYDTVEIYLALLRHSAAYAKIFMNHGFYHYSMSSKEAACQLILLTMDKRKGIVPRMQLGHHGLSVRLCEAASMKEIHSTRKMEMDLGICMM